MVSIGAGEGAFESAAGSGEAVPRQDTVCEDGDHEESAAVARPGQYHRWVHSCEAGTHKPSVGLKDAGTCAIRKVKITIEHSGFQVINSFSLYIMRPHKCFMFFLIMVCFFTELKSRRCSIERATSRPLVGMVAERKKRFET